MQLNLKLHRIHLKKVVNFWAGAEPDESLICSALIFSQLHLRDFDHQTQGRDHCRRAG
jgi:hypothetical protein